MLNPFLAVMQSRPVSRRRKFLALGVALFNDTLRLACGGLIGFIDPIDDLADVVTAIALAAILGFQWPMIFACISEAIPGVAVFPTWTAFVLLVPTTTRGNVVDESAIVQDADIVSENRNTKPASKVKPRPRDSVLALLIVALVSGLCWVH